jgi:hypothetical protein
MGPLCHLKVQHNEGKWTGGWWYLTCAFHGFIILAGCALGGWTVYSSVDNFIKYWYVLFT